MSGRIVNVLYWLGCALAALTIAAGAALYVGEGHSRSDGIGVLIGFVIIAAVIWVVGRALLYVLAAR
jgi:hypothetical protein